MAAGSVGKIGLDLVVNKNGFDKQMAGIQQLAVKAGKALAAAFTTKKLVEFGKSCIDLGSDLAEVQNVVDVAFPNMSEKINKFAANAAKQFGLSETMAKRYSGTFGSMAKAFGFTEAAAADMSTALTGLAGDVASFYNIQQDEAYTKLKSVFTGETESLKDLGVVMTQTALDAFALENGFGKTTQAMSEAEKVALRYQFVQSKLADAQGDFARTSDGWANQVRILTLQFESLKAEIGQSLIRVFSPVIKLVNTLLGRLLTLASAFNSLFGGSGGGGAAKNTKLLSDSAGDLASSYSAAADSATNLGSSTAKAAKKAKDAAKKLRSLMGFDQVQKVSEKEDSSKSSDSSSGIGGGGEVSYGVDVDTSSLDKATEKTLKFGKSFENVKKALAKLKVSFEAFAGLAKSGLKWTYDNILVPLGKWTINKLVPKLIEALAAAFDVLTAAGNALKPLWQWLWDNLLKKLAKFAGDAIIKFLDLFIKGLKALASWISKHQTAVQNITLILLSFFAAFKMVSLVKKFVGIFSKVSSAFGVVTKAIGLFTSPMGIAVIVIGAVIAAGVLLWKNWDKISAKLKKFAEGFKKSWKNLQKSVGKIIDKIVDGVKNIPKNIKKFFGEKIKGAEEWFAGIKEGFFSALDGLTENLPDLSEIKEAIANKIGEVKAKITGAIETASNWWDNAKTTLISKVTGAVASIKGAAETASNWWDNTKDVLAKKAAGVVSKIQGAAETASNWWKDTKSKLADKAAGVISKISGAAETASNWWSNTKSVLASKAAGVVSKISGAAETASNWWSNTKSTLLGKLSGMKATVTASISTTASTLQQRLTSILSGIKKRTLSIVLSFSAAASDLKKWVNTNVIDRVNNKFKNVPILKDHLIPHLAQGGYVARNTPQLAMIGDNRHQGEVVSPEKKLRDMAVEAAKMAQAAGGSNAEVIALLRQIITLLAALRLEVYLDGKSIKDRVVTLINNNTKATGVCEIHI